MKRYLFVVLLLLITYLNSAQVPYNVFDEKSQMQILIGEANRSFIKEGVFGESYAVEYANYKVDSSVVRQINSFLSTTKNSWSLKIFLGTWCGDSKEQVPRFFKIADQLVPEFAEISLVCVDRAKKAGDMDLSGLKIEKVPTFVFYRDGLEVGRIVETPTSGKIESDILRILSIK